MDKYLCLWYIRPKFSVTLFKNHYEIVGTELDYMLRQHRVTIQQGIWEWYEHMLKMLLKHRQTWDMKTHATGLLGIQLRHKRYNRTLTRSIHFVLKQYSNVTIYCTNHDKQSSNILQLNDWQTLWLCCSQLPPTMRLILVHILHHSNLVDSGQKSYPIMSPSLLRTRLTLEKRRSVFSRKMFMIEALVEVGMEIVALDSMEGTRTSL